jgi:spore coat polysaccharide biosynthesis predicted glycosyltransferase SpsG
MEMNHQRRFLVRVDGSKDIGLGHVYNMLTFLNYLEDEKIVIVMNKRRSLGSSKFKKYGYNVKYFSKRKELVDVIKNFQPDIICNDILNSTTSYMKFLKRFNCLIVNFEDLGNGRKLADLVFNPIYYAKKHSRNEFYGEKFACVREEFRVKKRKAIRKNVKKIVITFGGTDPTNKTQKILEIFKLSDQKNVQLIVILGLGYSRRKEIKNLAKKMNVSGFNVKIIERSDNLSQHFKDCDFAITSNGRTVFEIAAMKIPMIAIAVNKRERLHSFVRYSKGGFHIDVHSKHDYLQILKKINEMMSYQTRNKFVKNMHGMDLLNGVERVKGLIYQKYKESNYQ